MSKRYETGSYGPHEEGPVIAELRNHLPDDEASSRTALLASGFADPGRVRLLNALAGGAVKVFANYRPPFTGANDSRIRQ